MIEIAIRVSELASSNLNSLVDKASSPVKMLKLLVLELEESIIALSRDATLAGRRARDCAAQAVRCDQSAEVWEDKAKFALAKQREDLARGALAERENARTAATAQRESHAEAEADADAAELRAAIGELETKLGEARARLAAELAQAQAERPRAAAARPAPSPGARRSEAVLDRIAALETRIDFAAAATPGAKAASLDRELEDMALEASLDAELAVLRKGVKRKK